MTKTPPIVIETLKSALAQGISKRGLSRAIGINSNALDLYLEGAIEPRTSTLEKMSKYFKVSVTYLLGQNVRETRDVDVSNPDMARAVEILEKLPDNALKKVVDMLELLQNSKG